MSLMKVAVVGIVGLGLASVLLCARSRREQCRAGDCFAPVAPQITPHVSPLPAPPEVILSHPAGRRF